MFSPPRLLDMTVFEKVLFNVGPRLKSTVTGMTATRVDNDVLERDAIVVEAEAGNVDPSRLLLVRVQIGVQTTLHPFLDLKVERAQLADPYRHRSLRGF